MITICLDEFGHFELEKNIFVGGAVYSGTDYNDEKIRIEAFLKNECEKAGGRFPDDLHRNFESSNTSIVNKIKANISTSLFDYIKNNGKYNIVCMIKSKRDREDHRNISNIVDDNIAGNLYEHMICNLINNILFSNIRSYNHTEVNLEIPTRLAVIPKDESDKVSQFETLGYKSINKEIYYNNKPSYGFYVTDEKTFKTSLASTIMYNKRKFNMLFNSINIRPIHYEKYNASMPFLYLADFLCNNIALQLDASKNDLGFEKLYTWAKESTGNEPFLWSYDDIDTIYNTAMDHYFKKELIETLDYIYESTKSESDFSLYYSNHWFSFIEKNIVHAFEIGSLDTYISKLNMYLHNNYINQDKIIFIFDSLWKIIIKNKDNIKKAALYKISDIGIRVYNHKGDIGKTVEFYDICKQLKDSVDIQEYLDTVNRVAVIYANKFDFSKALELSSYNVECFSILKKAKQDIAMLNEVNENISMKLTSLGRALSSEGQYLAYIQDKTAISKFEEAIKEFADDEANVGITTSYLLHCAIDQNNLPVYQGYSIKYFGNNHDLEAQFDYIVNVDIQNRDKNYLFYIFIRALNLLYFDSISQTLIEKIRVTDYKNKGFNTSGHPWELIYKNIGIILYKCKYNTFAKRFMQSAYSCIKNPGATIMAINYFTKIQEGFYDQDLKLLSRNIKELKDWSNKDIDIKLYFGDAFADDINATYENLNKKFTYMYA